MLWHVYLELFWQEVMQLSDVLFIWKSPDQTSRLLTTSVAQFQWTCLFLACKLLTDWTLSFPQRLKWNHYVWVCCCAWCQLSRSNIHSTIIPLYQVPGCIYFSLHLLLCSVTLSCTVVVLSQCWNFLHFEKNIDIQYHFGSHNIEGIKF